MLLQQAPTAEGRERISYTKTERKGKEVPQKEAQRKGVGLLSLLPQIELEETGASLVWLLLTPILVTRV